MWNTKLNLLALLQENYAQLIPPGTPKGNKASGSLQIHTSMEVDWKQIAENPTMKPSSMAHAMQALSLGSVIINLIPRGVHCIKHVRVYVSAQKGY